MVLPTDEELAQQVAEIREASLRFVARDPDGWDDLWVLLQEAYNPDYHFDPADRNRDTDGDGLSDYEEMLVHRNASEREPVYTKEERVERVRLGQAARIEAERENLRALLPRIEAGLRAAAGAEGLPAVAVDATTSMLVNDLDLKVVRPEGGAALESWKLNPAAPRSAAVRGDNTVDTVEQVTVVPLSGSFLTAGTYKLQITHKGSLRRAQQTSTSPLKYQLLTGEYQKFSVAVSGNVAREGEQLLVTSIARAITGGNALVPLTWAAVKGLRYRVQRSLDLQSWTDVGGDLTATSETGTSTITETLGETQVFYRIKEVSP